MAKVTLRFSRFEADIETAAAEALGASIRRSHRALRSRISATRRKTRRSVVSSHRGTRGRVGVVFPPGSRYRARNTETERIVEAAWRRIEKQAFETVEHTFADFIEDFEL